ncbi:squalene synthase HpnC [Cupriavidus sp. AU9028]|uniref:squalene synthase HpnC n=1 Tax=Cupriavidus sp. AU9028 TaxID=2871157 RepID=UPI001C986804|nr:squalene synthase HpnC [Cupriavidus sp. AU9028]MBY4897578.1 squalene synthase HpnC [Cupriavidus sp. AU9028]
MPAHPSRPGATLDADAPVTHYENFPVASLLLPARLRRPVAVIYHFARTADDIADEGDAAPPERLAALDALEQGLHRIAAGADPGVPLLQALQRVVGDHALPLAPFHCLLQAFRQDVLFRPHPDWDSLLDYSSRSANPVGHLMLHLYGTATPERILLADRICTGLQLVNFWQDVAIDHARGRVYLPADMMARHGVTEAQLGEERCDGRWRALLADLVSRTRAMLQSGASLALTLPAGLEPRIGWELRLVVQGGLRILERIEAAGYDVFRRRPTLGAADWALLLWRAARMRKPNEPDH